MGVAFDLVMQDDRVRPARVASRGALDLRVRDSGRVAGDAVYCDGDELRVGAKS